jgi:hypothetical protein
MCGSGGEVGVRFVRVLVMRSAMKSKLRALKCVVAAAAAIAAPSALYAQGCAMCYQSAAAAGPRTAEALRHGILIMLFPPLFIFAGIIVLAHRRRNDVVDDGAAEYQDESLDFDDTSRNS